MVITINSPVRTDSSRSDAIRLSSQDVIFPEGTTIPGKSNLALKLKYSLLALMESTRDGFVIRSGWVDEEGYGSTYTEAYNDFLTSLRDRYESLRRREKRLSPRDLSILNRLRLLLAPSQI